VLNSGPTVDETEELRERLSEIRAEIRRVPAQLLEISRGDAGSVTPIVTGRPARSEENRQLQRAVTQS
jgi:hypothetical protein